MTTRRLRIDTRTSLVVLFAIYLVLLTWAVLWKLDVPYVGAVSSQQVKLIPFVSTTDAGGSDPLEVLANVIFFVPFGLYVGLLARRASWWTAAGIVGATSITFEVIQYFLGLGIADLSDVVANTAGGLAGFGLARLGRTQRASGVTAGVLAVATGVVLIATLGFLVSPQHYAPPRDVGPLLPLQVHGQLRQ